MSSIGIEIPFKDLPPSDTVTATLEYREDGTSTWLPALPLRRVRPDLGSASMPASVVHALAGSVLFLDEGKTFNLRATVHDSRQGYTQIFQSPDDFPNPVTQSIPPAAPAPTVGVSTVAALRSELASAAAGKHIRMANATYALAGTSLSIPGVSANALNRVILSGETRNGAIIDAGGSSATAIFAGSDIDFWVFENFTIQNAKVGLDICSSNTLSANDIVIRRLIVKILTNANLPQNAQAKGIEFRFGANRRFHVYDNILEGELLWTPSNLDDGNVFGIAFHGQGHTIHHNTLSGFMDSISSAGSGGAIDTKDCDVWRNDILWSLDDAIELDQLLRCACYENRITNARMGISCQPSYAGPVYIVRNFLYNMALAPFKFKNDPSGMLFYHNTCVKGDGLDTGVTGGPGAAWPNGNGSDWSQFEGVNNIYIGIRSTGAYTVACGPEPYNGQWRIDGNGYFPQGRIRYDGTVGRDFATVEVAIVSGEIEANGRLLTGGTSGIFNDIGADPAQPWYTTQASPRDPSLASGSSARGVALSLPNIGGTDIGCLDFGGSLPDYGSRV